MTSTRNLTVQWRSALGVCLLKADSFPVVAERRMRPLASIVLALSLLAPPLSAQAGGASPPTSDSVTVVSGEQYEAGSLFTAFMGGGYRSLWTTPIRVPVADLAQWGGGGLTPFDIGGGMTTKTLHLRGADGRRYVLRSVDKTVGALGEDLQGTPVEAIMQDQLSSFHPSGAVITASLLEAVGVLHPQPLLVQVPDSPLLGEYREEFAGMLALFEERPDDLPDGEAGFAGSRRIEQTPDLFDELEEDPGDRVDAYELLKARLIDILVGDRDRSENNYLWARFDDVDGGRVWRSVPRDRDQAFVQFDGFLKGLARNYDPRLVRFEEDYPNIGALTRNAWDIDRNLLVGLDRATWDTTVEEVKTDITDAVISDAVSRMPREHYALIGPELEANLRNRRDNLEEAAQELYEIVFGRSDIHATDEDEVATIDRLGNGGIRVVLQERGPNGDPQGSSHFDRVFAPDETQEVRVYLHGGDDLGRVRGDSYSPIGIYLVGGGGRDEFVNSPSGGRIRVYDGGSATAITGSGIRFDNRPAPRPWSWRGESLRVLDWGSRTMPEVRMGYDGDRGFMLHGDVKTTRYGFLKDPYSSRTQARFGWAFGRSKPFVDVRQYHRGLFGGAADLSLRGRYSGVEIVDFYGLGNETLEAEPRRFYKVDQGQLLVTASLSFGDGERTELAIGPVFKLAESDTTVTGNFVAERRPYGSGTFLQLGVQAALDLDRRNHLAWPTSGYHITAGTVYYPQVLDLEDGIVEARGEIATYLSPSGGNPTLATRVGGKHVWGTFPYHESALIGGSANVRGLREQRFAGRSSLYGSAELRVSLGRFFLLFPADFGVLGFGDLGRVFQDDLPSDKWHKSYGGGIWIAPVTRATTFQISIGRSEGLTALYFGLGFAF